MDMLSGLLQGFIVALAPANLALCFVGCFLGTIIGILPGLGPAATIAMLLPLTFKMDPTSALIMLAGIYYGSKYGGSTTSILLNVPGESASVVTCLDGYQMARNGRGGAALGIAAIASFVAGTFGVVLLMLISPPLASFGLRFSSPEYFALMALGLAMVVLLAGKSMIKALLAMLVGLWIAGMGTDLFTAGSRFTFGHAELLDGIDFIVVAIGVFALGEVINNMERNEVSQMLPVPKGLRNLLPSMEELKVHEQLGLRTGLVPMAYYDADPRRSIAGRVREMARAAIVQLARQMLAEVVAQGLPVRRPCLQRGGSPQKTDDGQEC